MINGRTNIPTATWKKEAAQLNAERQILYTEYMWLKEEVKEAKVILRCVETVLHEPQVKRGLMYEENL